MTEKQRTTCVQCGKKLRGEFKQVQERVEETNVLGDAGHYMRFTGEKEPMYDGRLGYGGNGFFCTMRCGFRWALDRVS